jgi:hypothetical protein
MPLHLHKIMLSYDNCHFIDLEEKKVDGIPVTCWGDITVNSFLRRSRLSICKASHLA